MEQKIEVKTFLIQYLCDDCNSNVTQDPVKKPVYTNETMQYPYVCTECGKNYTFEEKYPRVMYEWTKP